MADLEEKDKILLLDDGSTSTAASKEILACLTSLNANMLAVNTSLQQFRSDLHGQNLPQNGQFNPTKQN